MHLLRFPTALRTSEEFFPSYFLRCVYILSLSIIIFLLLLRGQKGTERKLNYSWNSGGPLFPLLVRKARQQSSRVLIDCSVCVKDSDSESTSQRRPAVKAPLAPACHRLSRAAAPSRCLSQAISSVYSGNTH